MVFVLYLVTDLLVETDLEITDCVCLLIPVS